MGDGRRESEPASGRVLTSVVHLQFSGAVLQNFNRRKTALWEMRGLSSQFFQTAELRRIQGPRKLQNRELRMSGFRGNCETATKPRNLLQNCRNAEKLRISADICRNLLYFRDCRTAEPHLPPELRCGPTAKQKNRGTATLDDTGCNCQSYDIASRETSWSRS